MKIEIHNYLSGSHLLESSLKEWDSIVILDSSLEKSDFVTASSARSLQLKFDDVTRFFADKIAPSHELIEEAIAFGLQSEKLVVCCRAGQSRSAATAFSIAFERLGKDEASKLLNPKRHSPNLSVLQIANEIVDRPGLLNAYDDWRASYGDVRMIDYLDEIEQEYEALETIGARNRIAPLR